MPNALLAPEPKGLAEKVVAHPTSGAACPLCPVKQGVRQYAHKNEQRQHFFLDYLATMIKRGNVSSDKGVDIYSQQRVDHDEFRISQ